jgi:hypothetical protein
MEALMDLVAASLARNGIECPQPHVAAGENSALNPTAVSSAMAARQAHVPNPIALPEHNYRKSLQGDPAP